MFDFFADPYNLEEITPDRLGFEVQEIEPAELGEGTHIRYTLRLHGVPIRWTSRITNWDPPHGFADVQTTGPYRRWEHSHRFVADGDETLTIDRVDYAIPFGGLGRVAHGLFVRRDLDSIFAYRADVLARRFGEPSLEG